MTSQTNEQALEAAIELALTGTTTEAARAAGGVEDAKAPAVELVAGNGFRLGLPVDFDRTFALDTKHFWRFLEQTQQHALEKLQSQSPGDWQRKVLERFDRMIKRQGVLHLLKKGLDLNDVHLELMYPAPLASSSERVKANFAANIFSCTRQLGYSLANPLQSIDMVLFVNGIPLVTLELKNPWTGQTARYHAQKQYREDRDPSQPLLSFGRCLVHMAVDTDEVFMTTRLAGQRTVFLPFNKGHQLG